MRPIDADILLKKDEWLTQDGNSYNVVHVIDILCAPTLDVEPVRHGRWVYDRWCEFKCSECGHFSDSKPYKGREPYCSECGAKMDLPSQ